MDLYSGLPYWTAKNPLFDYFNPLTANYKKDVIIIGSGITGALVAHELCKADVDAAIIDKRSISTGSSVASTSLLQYEIDVPLCEMINKVDEAKAVLAYKSCLESISDIEDVFNETRINPDFLRVPSIYYASNEKGLKMLKKEYSIRKKHGLPVTFLDKDELQSEYSIAADGALFNNESAQMDCYSAAIGLINYHLKRKELDVFTNTEITEFNETTRGYELKTQAGHTIKCRYVVIAAGFEAGKFLPKKVMNLTSTYALISERLDGKYIWPERNLIWETKEPYLYIRTTNENRIIVGGEDEPFKDPIKRDELLRKKVEILEKKISKLFPYIPFKTDMAWCGTFSSTDDGLPYIGTWPGKDKMFFALGYGGNGITFSMIAAQLIRNKLKGKKDKRSEVFGFDRLKK